MSRPPVPELGPLGVTRVQGVSIVSVSIILFLVAGGPLWEHAWQPDRNILWSYAPIPPLVFVCQVWNQAFRVVALLTTSFVLAAVKYLITAAFLLTLLGWSGGPPPRHAPEGPPPPPPDLGLGRARALQPPFPASIRRADIEGKIEASAGDLVRGALVVADGSFDAHSFDPPSLPYACEVGEGGFEPPLLALPHGARLKARARDDLVHSLLASGRGEPYLFHVPVVGETDIAIDVPPGMVRIRCTIHSGEELEMHVLRHPFVTQIAPDGSFKLRAVPEGNHALVLLRAGRQPLKAPVGVRARSQPMRLQVKVEHESMTVLAD